jgi:transposase-like protein
MNRRNFDKRVQAIHCLVEGNSIRSTERLVGAHRDTIMRLRWTSAKAASG